MQEIWIHKYKYSHEKKRKKFRKLLKLNKVEKVKNPEYKLSSHIVYKYIRADGESGKRT